MPHAPSDLLSRRHASIRSAMADTGLDALVVFALPNITWLTNFVGSAAIVVLTRDRLLFITDSRYVTAVSDMTGTVHECPGLELVEVDGAYDPTLASVLAGRGSGRVGFEASHLTVSRFQWLEQALAAATSAPALVPVGTLVEAARSVKDAYEIALFRTAGAMLSEVTRTVLSGVPRAGMTEREVAFAIDALIRLSLIHI